MTAYASGFRTVRATAPEDRPNKSAAGDAVVDYTPVPVWLLLNPQEAELHLRQLRLLRPHIGGHWCDLALEALPEGYFAIVCDTHPLGAKLEAHLENAGA
jgi:hypothetical protein